MKSIVLLSFKTYTQGVLLNFTDKVIQNMNSDAQFTSLKPQVDEMSLCFAEYKTIANDVNALGPLSTRAKADKKETFMHQLTIVARRVDELADGNESVVLAAGFEVRTAAKAIDSVEPPTNATNRHGTVGSSLPTPELAGPRRCAEAKEAMSSRLYGTTTSHMHLHQVFMNAPSSYTFAHA